MFLELSIIGISPSANDSPAGAILYNLKFLHVFNGDVALEGGRSFFNTLYHLVILSFLVGNGLPIQVCSPRETIILVQVSCYSVIDNGRLFKNRIP